MDSADLGEWRGVAGRRGAVVALTYLLLGAVVLAPIALVRVPCLGDYLNHLARIHIESAIARSAVLQRYYEPHLHWVPYFGMDVPVLLMAPVLGLYGAGRVFVALCVVVPVAGAAALHKAIYGRVSLVPVLAFAVCYNYVLSRGFLAYLFSAGLAVLLFAGWIAAAGWRRWQLVLVFAPAALVLFMSHVFAFGAYGILIAGYELDRAARRRGRSWQAKCADLATAGSQAVAPVLLVWLLHVDGGFGVAQVTHYGTVAEKISAVFSPVFFPGGSFVLTVLLGLALAGACVLAWWLATGRARIAPCCVAPLIALSAAAVVMPHVLFNVWGADYRFPLVALIVLVGALAPAPRLGRRAAAAVLGAACGMAVLAAANAAAVLLALDGQVAAVRTIVAKLPDGVRLLVVDGPGDAPERVAPPAMTGHIGLVAAIDRNAFVPFLFTGATALQVRPAFRDTASPNAEPVTLGQLREGYDSTATSGPLPVFGYGGTKYWMGWPDKFDYVLITDFGAPAGRLPADLRLVEGGSIASLYRVAAP